MMQQLAVKIPAISATSYPIMIGVNIEDFKTWLPNDKVFKQIVIITDNWVKKHYGLALQNNFQQAGYACLLISFPAGEKYKNYQTKQIIEEQMLGAGCARDILILALGGGVVGDIAGYIAATYMRGVPYIQIPTTLLAMVDSSVGGKTGINTTYGKNLSGVIYQPLAVVVDIAFLNTLSKNNIINGLIEAIKMFLTHDAKSFQYVQNNLSAIINGDHGTLQEVVTRAIKIKAAVVARDPKEQGERNLLNFGHTVGHALEKISNYCLLHGYAVAYGILVEATLSHALGFLATEQLSTIKALFTKLGIRGKDLQLYKVSALICATKNDKKMRDGLVNYTLLQDIGCALIANTKYVHPVTDTIVKAAFKCVTGE